MATTPIQHVNVPSHYNQKPIWPWVIVVAGYFLPGVIGVCVRQYLQSIGRPVMPWSWVAQEVGLFVIFSFIWVLPFVFVALIAALFPLAESKYHGLVYGALMGTALFEVLVFIDAWWNVEAIILGFLVIPFLVFGGTLLGGGLGFLTGWLIGRARHKRSAK
jgi:hypothetical protein